jgi:hypothetical protein
MIVSEHASPSCYESDLYPLKNVTEESFFDETITASSLLKQIEEVGTF